MINLVVFICVALVLALTPVFVGCRMFGVGNPSWFNALLAVVAALALQDLAMTFIDDIQLAWLASLLLAAFAFSLLIDCSYWKGFLLATLVITVQIFSSATLLDGTPPTEELSTLIAQAQAELWPQYH